MGHTLRQAGYTSGVGSGIDRARHSRAAEQLARFGLAAKGFVYVMIGVLAIQVARGDRSRAEDAKGALSTLADEPFGTYLLVALGISLLGYVFLRIMEAIADPEREGAGVKGLVKRGGKLLSGIIYFGIALFAINLGFGNGASQGGGSGSWAAKALRMPLGEWWVLLAGIAIAAYGAKEIWRGWRDRFDKQLPHARMNSSTRGVAMKLGRAGLAARGVILLITGFFLMKASANSNAGEVRGIDGALETLGRQAYGDLLLGAVAAGLAAYGIFQMVQARYRRIQT